MQVTNGGSNLSYGLRSLYIKHFSRFDEWLVNPSAPAKPVKAAEGPVEGKRKDAEAHEAAAILESLGTGPDAPSAGQPEPKADSKKRKADKADSHKVR